MSDVPRPPFSSSLGERFWDRVAQERDALLMRRADRDHWLSSNPSPGDSQWAGAPTARRPGALANFSLMVMIAAGSVTMVLGALWGWQQWSQRSQAPVEDLIPRVTAPVVPTAAPSALATSPAPSAAAGPVASEVALGGPEEIVVHVAGAVRRPGVVMVVATDRVIDAIDAAGGALPEADLDRINLAAPLRDGQHVYVLDTEEIGAPIVTSGSLAGPEQQADAAPIPVDINTATAAELEDLPGVGPATAASIVAFRTKRGPFFEAAELMEVPGIGPAKFEAMESLVAVGALAPTGPP